MEKKIILQTEEQKNLEKYREQDIKKRVNSDITSDWSKSSRLFFYLKIGLITIVVTVALLTLYKHRYKSNSDIEIPTSSLYTPKYK